MTLALDGTGSGVGSAPLTTANPPGLIFSALISNSGIARPTATGLTFVRRAIYTNGFNAENGAVFYAPYTTPFSGTITNSNAVACIVWGVSGVYPGGSAFDPNATLPAISSQGFTFASTTNANDFIFGTADTGVSGNPAPGAGWTTIAAGTEFIAEYQIVNVTQSNLTVTLSVGTPHGTILDAVMARNPGWPSNITVILDRYL
jgi:hypothetical protein